MVELMFDQFEGGNLPSSMKDGLHQAVKNAVAAINLEVARTLVAKNQKWGKKRMIEIEGEYRKALSQFALTFEGVGLVSCLKNDVAVLWQAHCGEGKKFASDMHAVVTALLQYRGKSLDEKFPETTD